MDEIKTQNEFEMMWFSTDESLKWIIYFTANWCKACKKLDIEEIKKIAEEKRISIFVCNESTNDYIAGYCGVRTYPTFMYFSAPRKIGSSISNNNTNTVIEWLKSL